MDAGLLRCAAWILYMSGVARALPFASRKIWARQLPGLDSASTFFRERQCVCGHPRVSCFISRGSVPLHRALERSLACFEHAHDLLGEEPQFFYLRLGDLTRLGVNYADRAKRMPRWHHQRCAGIEADAGRADHQRILRKARILRCIFHDHDPVGAFDGVSTKRDRSGCLIGVNPHARLEPLPVAVHDRDKGHWRFAKIARHASNVLERRFLEVCQLQRVELGLPRALESALP